MSKGWTHMEETLNKMQHTYIIKEYYSVGISILKGIQAAQWQVLGYLEWIWVIFLIITTLTSRPWKIFTCVQTHCFLFHLTSWQEGEKREPIRRTSCSSICHWQKGLFTRGNKCCGKRGHVVWIRFTQPNRLNSKIIVRRKRKSTRRGIGYCFGERVAMQHLTKVHIEPAWKSCVETLAEDFNYLHFEGPCKPFKPLFKSAFMLGHPQTRIKTKEEISGIVR